MRNSSLLNETIYFDEIMISENNSIFYTLMKSRSSSSQFLIINFEGGYTCSGLHSLFKNNGPFLINRSLSSSINKNSLNEKSDVLYMDIPYGIGYSKGNLDQHPLNLEIISDDFFKFIKIFFEENPDYSTKKMAFHAENEAAHLVSLIAYQNLFKYNQTLNLVGMLLGNPLIDFMTQIPFINEYGAYYLNIDTLAYVRSEFLIFLCKLAYKRNKFNIAILFCLHLINEKIIEPVGLNYHDISETCKEVYLNNFQLTNRCYGSDFWNILLNNGIFVDVFNQTYPNYFENCIPHIKKSYYLSDGILDYTDKFNKILDNKISVWMYFGKTDLVLNYQGGMKVTENFEWTGKINWQRKTFSDFLFDDKIVGHYKSYSNLHFYIIFFAGHQVSMSQPKIVQYLLELFMEGH